MRKGNNVNVYFAKMEKIGIYHIIVNEDIFLQKTFSNDFDCHQLINNDTKNYILYKYIYTLLSSDAELDLEFDLLH